MVRWYFVLAVDHHAESVHRQLHQDDSLLRRPLGWGPETRGLRGKAVRGGQRGASVLQEATHRFNAHVRTTVDWALGRRKLLHWERRAGYVSYPKWQQGFSVIYFEGRFRP
jgi:hypothetical protein